jgi:putative ATP-binding cassette transporter
MQALVVGAITYQIPVMIGLHFMRRRRKFADKLQQSVRGLLDGFKELKLDKRKREAFLTDYLYRDEHGVRDSAKAADAIVTVAGTYGDMISFLVIGIMSFVFVNYHSISSQELIAVIMTLLYITGPVAGLLQVMPQYMNAGVSLGHVNRLFADMPKETAKAVYEPAAAWESVRFDNVVYRYASSDDKKGYVVGPVSFEVRKGEITFIVGGNGSGKSTLSKLVTLHYEANSGAIHFGGTHINDDTLNIYRQHIAFIYSDYYLFDRLLGVAVDPIAKATVERYLQELGLEHKVTFEDGRFSTLHLSDGQKRRLALLVAFVEDKELYLFDEWAADQDSAFKNVFYYRILPELKRRGKAVVVVSHDDRYFSVADNILFMENGLLVESPEVGCAKAEAALA